MSWHKEIFKEIDMELREFKNIHFSIFGSVDEFWNKFIDEVQTKAKHDHLGNKELIADLITAIGVISKQMALLGYDKNN